MGPFHREGVVGAGQQNGQEPGPCRPLPQRGLAARMEGGSRGKEAKAARVDTGGLDGRDGGNGKTKEIPGGPRNHVEVGVGCGGKRGT